MKKLSLTLALLLSGCTNNMGLQGAFQKATKFTSGGDNIRISEAKVGSASVTILIDSKRSAFPLSDYCSDRECECEYKWRETNETSGRSVSLTRKVRTSFSLEGDFSGRCGLPKVWDTEISNGTNVQIKVASKGGEVFPSGLTTGIIKGGTTSVPGTSGQGFLDILRYSCYQSHRSLTSLVNRRISTADRNSLVATQYCTEDDAGTGGECSHAPGARDSAQAQYYNLYVTDRNLGAISAQSGEFTCPVVTRGLDGSRNYFPLDSTFRLKASYSDEYKVPVETRSVLSISADAATTSQLCPMPAGSTRSGRPLVSPGGVSSLCVGYAKAPNLDGTCSPTLDDQGKTVPTYRLRRYISMAPQEFEVSGKLVKNQHRAYDVAFVLDRPVRGLGDRTYTMLGPKPCPQSYFDHSGVLGENGGGAYDTVHGGKPTYRSSLSNDWNGKNIDGIHFPNRDSASDQSCSAALPIVTNNGGIFDMALGTTHASNNKNIEVGGTTVNMKTVFVRPRRSNTQAWVEDKDFMACAPRSKNYREPPLHISRVGNEVAYCAEVYPTQHPNPQALDRNEKTGSNPGYVKPFTSHVSKNSNSQSCNAEIPGLPGNWPSVSGSGHHVRGAARHPSSLIADADGNHGSHKTCDRTIESLDGSPVSKTVPLLANPSEVEEALRNNGSYQCSITYDEGRGRRGVPSGGCCALAQPKRGSGSHNAHFEPSLGQDCGIPTY